MKKNPMIFNSVHKLAPKTKPAATTSGYRVVARGNDAAEIYLYGAIGGDWYGEGVTAKQFANDLKGLGNVKTIDLRINSEGGSVFDGKAMYSLLNEHPAKIIVHVDGLAASAASFIAMAGDEIEIAEGGFVMIHNAYMVAIGDAREMRRAADMLETVNNTIVDVYVSRTKGDRKAIQQMMDDETWLTGADAVKHGFADKMVENLKVAASVSHPDRFKNLPAALRPNRVRAAAALARIAAIRNAASGSKYGVGDKVKVKPGKEHDTMTKGKTGTVEEVSAPALGIKFEGMSDVHYWYTDSELDKA